MQDKRAKMLGETALVPLFLKLAIPSIIAMLTQALYILVDRYFVGNIPEIGGLAISGLGVAMPLLYILMGISMLFGIGGAANISIKMGQKDMPGAEKVLANALKGLAVLTLIVNLSFLIFAQPLLQLFGATTANLPFAMIYLPIIVSGNFWNSFSFALNHLVRSEGNTKRAMYSLLTGAISNAILDYVFIVIFHWGIAGAAFATIIAQFFSFLIGASYYLLGQSSVKLKLKEHKWNFKIIGQIIAIGFSPFFMQIAGALLGAILNNALKTYGGSAAQGAYAILAAVVMIFFMQVFGMNQALQPIIGYNFGAKNYQRVKETTIIGVVAASIVLTLGWLLIQTQTAWIVNQMNDDADVIKIAIPALKTAVLCMPIIGIQIISTTLFQSIGKAKIAFLLSLSRQVLLLTPLLLILPNYYQLNGIWYAMVISDFLSTLIAVILLVLAFKKLNQASSELLAAGSSE